MRAVVQRVSKAGVDIDGKTVGEIGTGLLVFLGIGKGDSGEDVDYLVEKIVDLRIFPDKEGQMNLSAREEGRELLIVPQFTLYGDCRQGRRPSFSGAASLQRAEELYDKFVDRMQETGLKIETGRFQSLMDVRLVNNGPVTMLLDSRRKF